MKDMVHWEWGLVLGKLSYHPREDKPEDIPAFEVVDICFALVILVVDILKMTISNIKKKKFKLMTNSKLKGGF